MNNHDGKEVKNTWLFKHGHRGRSDSVSSRTYKSWVSMKERCLNKNNHNYERYGARGISICDEWIHDFEAFVSDMGERPDGHTIDRLDVNGNYCKENCRWSTPKQQAENRRTTNKFLFKGEYVYASQLTEIYRIAQTTLRRRIANGMTDDDLIKPARRNAKKGDLK